MARVSRLLPFLSHHRLLADGVIPDLFRSETVPRKRQPPPTTSEQNYAHFGLFVDHLMINMYLSTHSGSHSNNIPIKDYYTSHWESVWLDLHKYTSSLFGLDHNPEKVIARKNYYVGLFNFVKSITLDGFCFESEITFDAIQGHPDIVHGSVIYDIKATQNLFGDKMYPHVCLQLLSYCALSRAMGKVVTHVGVVLPMQRMIIKQDVSDWNSSAFLVELMRAYQYYNSTCSMNDFVVINKARTELIGSHVAKYPGLIESIEKIPEEIKDVAIQIFLRAPKQIHGKVANFSNEIAAATRRLCRKRNLRLYIHSPYVINLCRESSSIDTIKDDLIKGRQLKSKGVVFHVGKRVEKDMKEIPLSECLNVMERKIRQLIPFASERTALCIETPAKQGKKKGPDYGEVLSNVNEMVDFYNRFTQEEKKKFKICVDTCHVFSAGYYPMNYIEELHERCPGAIRLVHYNGSAVPLGACNDSHADVCGGYVGLLSALMGIKIKNYEHIGMHEMAKVATWCMENNIDGVVE